MKKALALVLVLLVAISAFAGCQPKVNTEATPTPSTAPEATSTPSAEPQGPAENVLPLADQKVEFSMWTSSSNMATGVMTDLNENTAFQELEKRTNVHLNFQYPAANMESEAFNLILAGQEYPDTLVTRSTMDYAGGMDKYIDQGVIIDLKDVVESSCPNYLAAFNSDAAVAKGVYTDTGALPAFRQVNYQIQPCYMGYMVRQDWLDKAGYQGIPETYDDWYNMLTAIKPYAKSASMYLNSNIGQDMILLAGYGISSQMFPVEGVVKFGPVQDNFKTYLQMLSKWYAEGLIDPSFMTRPTFYMDGGLFMSEEVGVYPHVYVFHDVFTNAGKPNNPDYKISGIPYPKMNKGDTRYIATTVSSKLGGAAATITTSCIDPVTLGRWWDYLYSEDGARVANYGVEGVSYDVKDGKPVFTDLVAKNPDKLSQGDATKKYAFAAAIPSYYDYTREISSAVSPEALALTGIWDKDWDKENTYAMGEISMTAEESSEYSSMMNDINTYVSEFTTRVITGSESIDNWDKYVAQIKSMKLDRCIEIQQAAYDRYINR